MGFLKRIMGLEPKLMKLLSARIIIDEDHRYSVSFRKHHPDLKMPEFARLVLHYYAKMLFNFDPADPKMALVADFLQAAMRNVLAQGIRSDSDILQAADIGDVARVVGLPPHNIPREITATLYFVSAIHRHIITNVPRNIYAQHAAFSVFALLQAALKEMDGVCLDILQKALSEMNARYESGESYSELSNLSVIPNMAYVSATMGD